MKSAIAFGAIVVVFGIFMPDVLHALTAFLLALFGKATAMLNALPASPADIGRTIAH